MSGQRTHRLLVGATRQSRRDHDEFAAADIVVDCHRRLRGPYSGTSRILCDVVPRALAVDADLVRRHDIEILSFAPELIHQLQPSRETLTSLAVPKERTRYYAANRTRRLAHGIVEFLDAYVRGTGGVLTLAFDTVHEADPGEQEFIAILLRRADADRVKVVVGTDGSAVSDELAAALHAYAITVDALPDESHRPAAAGESTAAELARRFVESDGTSDVDTELRAYEALHADARAVLHDARADILEREGPTSAQLGAVPYHRTHGSDPQAAAAALQTAVRHCQDRGFYPAVAELGTLALALIDPCAHEDLYVDIGFMLINGLVALQRAAEAESVSYRLRSVTTNPRVHLNATYMVGMVYTRFRAPEERQHDVARAHLNTAIALASQLSGRDGVFQQAFQRNGLALVEMHQGNLRKALELVDWGVRELDGSLRPDEHMLHRSVLLHNRANVYLALGRIAEGVADLDRVIEADPNYAEYYFDRANLQRRLGAHEVALADYARAIELSPPFPELHYNKADLLAEMGRTDAAIEGFAYVLELEPDHHDARVNLATLRFESGDLDGALADVREGLAHHPGDPYLLCTQGLVLQELGRPEEALAAFTAALDADPTMTAALSNRAALQFDCGDAAGAITDLTRAVELDPDNVDVRYNRGYAYEHVGALDEAIADFTAALDLPGADIPELLRRRGTCHAEAGRDAEAAVDLRASADADGAERLLTA